MSANIDLEIEVTPDMIAAGARIIADRFDLEIGGWSAESVAEDVIRASLAAIAKIPRNNSPDQC